MALNREQTKAFLDALWPCGEQSHLSSHARTYFSALIGEVPHYIPNTHLTDDQKRPARKLADVLRDLAENLDRSANDPKYWDDIDF